MQHLPLQGRVLTIAGIVCRPPSAPSGRCQSCPAKQQSPNSLCPRVRNQQQGCMEGLSREHISSAPLRLPPVLGCETILRPARENITIIDLTEALIQLYEHERGNSHSLPRSYTHTREMEGDIQLEV